MVHIKSHSVLGITALLLVCCWSSAHGAASDELQDPEDAVIRPRQLQAISPSSPWLSFKLDWIASGVADNTALNMDIVLSWTANGVSYTVSPFIVSAGGATYNGNNINAVPKQNWETISWNNPASPPQAGNYYVCAVCNGDACGKTYTLTVSITGAAEGFIGALRTLRTGFTNPPNPYVCTATSPHRIVTYGRAPRNPPPPPPFRGRSLLSQSPPSPSTADTIRGGDQDALSS